MDLTALFRILPLLRDNQAAPETKVQTLYDYLFENHAFRFRPFEFGPLTNTDDFELRQALDLVLEVIVQYSWHFHDPRLIPVTYYKREKRTRRHLDQQFSKLFSELMRRSRVETKLTLVTAEPIYYLMQQAREKSFPKSRDGKPNLVVLRQRLQLELSRSIDLGPETKKILLPHEIR